MASQYNKILTTVNSVTSDYSFTPDLSNVIVIDTSNNRIGINTVNPQYSIDCNGQIRTDSLEISDNLLLKGDASFNSNVEVSNNLLVNGDASFNSNVEVSNNLMVKGDELFNSTVEV